MLALGDAVLCDSDRVVVRPGEGENEEYVEQRKQARKKKREKKPGGVPVEDVLEVLLKRGWKLTEEELANLRENTLEEGITEFSIEQISMIVEILKADRAETDDSKEEAPHTMQKKPSEEWSRRFAAGLRHDLRRRFRKWRGKKCFARPKTKLSWPSSSGRDGESIRYL